MANSNVLASERGSQPVHPSLRLPRHPHKLRVLRNVLVTVASLLPTFLAHPPRDRRRPCCSRGAPVNVRGLTNCAPQP